MKRNVTFFITMLALLSMTVSVLAQGGKAGEIAIDKAGFFPESVDKGNPPNASFSIVPLN